MSRSHDPNRPSDAAADAAAQPAIAATAPSETAQPETGRSGEPSTKGEATRFHILCVAADLFWARNFHGLSMGEICAAANVNKATLYRYFPSKDALAEAALAYFAEATERLIFHAAFAEAASPAARLRAIYRRLYETHSQIAAADGAVRPCPIGGLAVEIGAEQPAVAAGAQAAFARLIDYFECLATAAQADGAASGWTPAQLAQTLMTLQHGALTTARIENRPAALLEAGEAAVALLTAAGPPARKPDAG